jgi:glycosyltransferase involved in cell wall biosynthesis
MVNDPRDTILLDVTRLIWRQWTGRISTGIDRVCNAYLHHYADRAQAVILHRGIHCILTPYHSHKLFDLLRGPDAEFRTGLIRLAPQALLKGSRIINGDRRYYLNVGHTDFDLDTHVEWTKRCDLRSVYMVHDLIPLTHSEFSSPHAIKRHRGRVINALRHASGILTNSEASAQDLRAFAEVQKLPIPPILASWLAGETLTKSDTTPIQREPYFVCVGTIEGRKNHFMLLQIWRRLALRLGSSTPRLVIIGQSGIQASHVTDMLARCEIIRPHVTVLKGCEDTELGSWIAGSRALLMPSFAEGFGLPVVEALEIGTPVIASDIPCFREIGQGIPMLLDPVDTIAWEKAIQLFGHNSHERQHQMLALGLYRPRRWPDHFAAVDSWLTHLGDRSG